MSARRRSARSPAAVFATILLLFVAIPGSAANPVRAVVSEARRYASDAAAIARAPLRWDERTWRHVALIVATDAAAFAVDERIAKAAHRNRSSTTDDFSRVVTPLGGGRGQQIAVATLLTGIVLKKPEVRDVGRDALEASILAAGVITPAIKRVSGRTRPNGREGAYAFDPFSRNESFPSGHTTNAFALASVFAGHSNGHAVPAIAYTLASAVAVARIHDDAHFASDVIAGAAIGTAVGRSIVARHRSSAEPASPRVSWAVVPAREGVAFQIAVPSGTLRAYCARLARRSAGVLAGWMGGVPPPGRGVPPRLPE